MTALYSFDIFDTLITRKVVRPSGIFVLMQNILEHNNSYQDIPQDVKDNFFQYRTNAEYRQRRLHQQWKQGLDVTFNQIYADIQNTYFLSNEQIEKLKTLEIELELKNIVPIYENINKLKSLIRNGNRVVLISDMYLPESVIKRMLYKCDVELAQVKLYLSSTLGYMKTTSELFKYVKQEECVEYSDWIHIGDNKKSDYEQARKLGIKSELYKYVGLKEYEKQILNIKSYNPVVQLSIGLAKNLRLNSENKSDKYQLGASLAGNVFYPFVSWMLEQCQKRGIKCLYFIARDGYILKEVADVLIREGNFDIETKYLYGSRTAWRLPSLTMDSELLYSQFVKVAMWTHRDLHKRFGMEKDVFKNYLPKEFQNYSKGLSKGKQELLTEFLLKDRKILVDVVKSNLEKRHAVINYLKQEIDFSKDDFAFVELDGSGFTQNCMAEFLKDVCPYKLRTFYLTGTCNVFPFNSNNESICFYNLRVPLMAFTLELLTRAPHGQTLGYENINNNWQPILDNFNQNALYKWGFEDFKLGVLAQAKEIFKCEIENQEFNFMSQCFLENYINFIFKNIDKDTANILGSIVHTLYDNENQEFAPKIRHRDCFKYMLTRKFRTESMRFSKARSKKSIINLVNWRDKHPNLAECILKVKISKRTQEAYVNVLGVKIGLKKLIFGNQ